MSANRKSLLFFTNSEWGQANVILATIYEFLVRDEYAIHIASYASLKSRLQDFFQTHAAAFPRKFKLSFGGGPPSTGKAAELPSLTFHTIDGLSVAETCHRDKIAQTLPHMPGLKGAVSSYHRLAEFMVRYTVEEYMESQRSAKQIINNVEPALILAEQGCNPGLDACYELGREFVILSPNSFKDFEQYLQPWLGILWKYPALSSAFPFPLPVSLIPANTYLWICMLIAVVGTALDKTSRLSILTKGRQTHGLRGPIPIVNAYKKASAILCPSLPELDFTMRVRPSTIGCGPIVLPVRPIRELDSELDDWLTTKGRLTVLVNLGTHYSMDSGLALEVARALNALLDSSQDIQILWKTMLEDGQRVDLNAVFRDHLSTGRIRVLSWIKPDPVALLETGKVAVQVHHGGANTYFECCRYGVRQIVLAAWWDTYEYAARVEYLGVGIFANKTAAPRVHASDLQNALTEVIDNPKIEERAKELAEICIRHGEGRGYAHDRIIEMIR